MRGRAPARRLGEGSHERPDGPADRRSSAASCGGTRPGGRPDARRGRTGRSHPHLSEITKRTNMPDLAGLIQAGAANPWLYLPAAILLGALHALEPGHSKSMMAAFIIA